MNTEKIIEDVIKIMGDSSEKLLKYADDNNIKKETIACIYSFLLVNEIKKRNEQDT